MSEYDEIKSALVPILERSGFKLKEENVQLDDFGSAYSEFFGKGLNYRIDWDGRNGCGYIQAHKNGKWVDLKASAPEGKHNAFEAALIRMRIALVEHIALAKLNA